MDPLNDHGVGSHQHAVLHDDGCGGGGLHHAGQHGPRADVAAGAHDGPASQHGPHVNHGARADYGADVDDGPHHDDGPLADFYLLPDDRAGLNSGLDALEVQQGHAGVPAVVFHDKVGNLIPAGFQNGAQLRPVTEDGEAVSGAEDLGGAEIHGAGGVDVELDRGFFLRVRDIGNDFLCVHRNLLISKVWERTYMPGSLYRALWEPDTRSCSYAPNRIFCRS